MAVIFRYKNGRIIPIKVDEEQTTNEYMNDKIRGNKTPEQIEIETINNNLKVIKSFNDFKNVEQQVNSSQNGLVFRTKKAKWLAHSFTENNGKVKYLLGDGISTRENKIEDLYKYIEISDRAR